MKILSSNEGGRVVEVELTPTEVKASEIFEGLLDQGLPTHDAAIDTSVIVRGLSQDFIDWLVD